MSALFGRLVPDISPPLPPPHPFPYLDSNPARLGLISVSQLKKRERRSGCCPYKPCIAHWFYLESSLRSLSSENKHVYFSGFLCQLLPRTSCYTFSYAVGIIALYLILVCFLFATLGLALYSRLNPGFVLIFPMVLGCWKLNPDSRVQN